MALSTKNGNRTQLRMVFNNIDYKLNHELENKAKKNKAEKKYLELIQKYKGQDKIINLAKHLLRCSVADLMTAEWIHEHAQKRNFKTQSDLKKEIFEKYLNFFRYELREGELSIAIQRPNVLKMPLFQK